jgi:hypothetical protein
LIVWDARPFKGQRGEPAELGIIAALYPRAEGSGPADPIRLARMVNRMVC